jgi:hypothetical protein
MKQSNNFFTRLGWQVGEARRNAESFTYFDEASIASEADENYVAANLNRRFADTSWECRASVRVPDPTASRHTEIDFVITGPDRVILVELKSWTGFVYLDERGFVVQERRNGEVFRSDLFGKLQDQAEVLRLFNASQRNMPVPISSYVVFCRPNLEIHESIEDRSDVLSFFQLVERTGMPDEPESPGLVERILTAIMRLFGLERPTPARKKTPAATEAILQFREMLLGLGSWDYVKLHGGQIVKGDILVPDATVARDVREHVLDRRTVEGIIVEVDRSVFKSLFRPPNPNARVLVHYWDSDTFELNVRPDTPFVVHQVGQSKPWSFELRNIEAACFGYTHRHKVRFTFDELQHDMLVVGKVTADSDHGVFVDLGLRDHARHARVQPDRRIKSAQVRYRKGQRLLVRVKKILREKGFIDVDIVTA